MSRVRKLEDLTLWDFDSNSIKIASYYQQLLKWCDSVDVIRTQPYTGEGIKYPVRELDTISCDDESKNNEVFEYNDFADPANNNIFAKINQQADSTKPKSYQKRVRCTCTADKDRYLFKKN